MSNKSNCVVSIIIVSFNKPAILKDTLKSIYKHISSPEYEIIVVDNNSRENNVSMIKTEFPQVLLIENKENSGFAKGCNLGSAIANGEYLLFVNSDILILSNPIPDMIELYAQNKNLGLVSAQLINKDGSLQPSYYGFPSLLKRFIELLGLKRYFVKLVHSYRNSNNFSKEISAGKGAFLMVPKTLFDKVGKFDEYYFMYIEDIDLSFQLKKNNNINMLYFSQNIIHLGWHVEKIEDKFGYFHRNRGLIYFYKKNYSKIKFYTFIILNKVFLELMYRFNKIYKKDKNKQESYRAVLELYKFR